MRVYPSPGLLVRDPVKRDFLPADGREVPDHDLYWIRRLECGDAILTAPVSPAVNTTDTGSDQ
ncbi:Protein of unknown function [Azotobacter beijerinckii]|uniref:DUF2635 domain-containing protein n=1 Tax=Azotobacter beijerinckii TaxID=170623 RepID=A0A1H6X266_9GAMM|nr:DUF2635 domain-containing protein [Azotobacter beijerinckii]SEJ21634.1 Protein of unknown function [Azotobacter beijerinckii]